MSDFMIFLDNEDFYVDKSSNGLVLCTKIPNLSFVLFYSNGCMHCHRMKAILKQLPNYIHGIQLGLINVDNNKKTIVDSSNTITQIKYVPFLMFYVNGIPYIQYSGEHKLEHVTTFLKKVISSLQNQHSSSFDDKKDRKKVQKNLPTLGIPICGKDQKIYCNVKEAYN